MPVIAASATSTTPYERARIIIEPAQCAPEPAVVPVGTTGAAGAAEPEPEPAPSVGAGGGVVVGAGISLGRPNTGRIVAVFCAPTIGTRSAGSTFAASSVFFIASSILIWKVGPFSVLPPVAETAEIAPTCFERRSLAAE